MKKLLTLICVGSLALSMLAACGEEAPAPAKPSEQAATPEPASAPAPTAPGKTGKILETMDAAGYTYIHVDTGSEQFWAAAPQFAAKVGDDVVVPEGMPMPEYHSKTLDRTFDVVYFVPSVMVGGAEAGSADLPEGHPPMNELASTTGTPTAIETELDLSNIAKAEGGQTVGEIFAKKAELAGKQVTLRGKVVKYSPEIMGTNWVHIQDGTGEAGSNDLTVTTSTPVKMGDTVTVKGVLVTDKDFGYGYQYALIIEDAEITVE